jgi:vitamin K-dependent gamma-carboxylase
VTPTDRSARSLADRVEVALLRPIDVAWLAAFRIVFGLLMAVSMERFLAYGWVDTLLVEPRFRFHYYGFSWVEPLSRHGMHATFVVLACLAVAVAMGALFRVTAPLLALGLTYIQLIDVSTYLNHYYLAALLTWLLTFSPANRAWSVDAWLSRRRLPPTIATAWLVLFRVQIGIVYVFAGLAKAQSDWLFHGQPLAIWLGASTSVPLLGKLFTLPGVAVAMSWLGFLFDTTIVGWLSWRRTRIWAYAVVLVFHTLTRLLFDIGMFPFIMSLAALVFFDPDWPRALIARFRRTTMERPIADARPLATLGHRIALGAGALYCVIQLLAPLRCHLYGGDVLWHEQGMRFSWRVMIRAKGGATTFVVRDKTSGRTLHVNPGEYLTPFQENEMSSQPDLILQLAHRIERDYAARMAAPVEVHVESRVSLNGRRGALLLDPDVDLARIEDGLGAARWVLPAPHEAPPHTRPVL